MTLPRLLAPDLTDEARVVELSPEESHHVAHVLRARRGDRVRLFDGRGREVEARVTGMSGRVSCAVVGPVTPVAEPQTSIVLAQALLTGAKTDEVVRDAVMLGVAALRPVRTRRGAPARAGRDGLEARWRRVAAASAKQCGRAVVPVVEPLTDLSTLLSTTAGVRVMLLEPAAAALPRFAPESRRPAAPVVVLAGPEGGWDPGEIAEAHEAGWLGWRLGPRVLRAERAAAVALAVLQHVWDAPPS